MKRKPQARYLAENGYPGQIEEANTDASIGQSHSSVTVMGRSYNSVLFGVSVERLMKHFPHAYTYLHGK